WKGKDYKTKDEKTERNIFYTIDGLGHDKTLQEKQSVLFYGNLFGQLLPQKRKSGPEIRPLVYSAYREDLRTPSLSTQRVLG
ncbi:MAG: hypothetical protein JW971_06435, partial [Synergistales bacterium]|nr:hypothetical protein [Synergistales bacterium]